MEIQKNELVKIQMSMQKPKGVNDRKRRASCHLSSIGRQLSVAIYKSKLHKKFDLHIQAFQYTHRILLPEVSLASFVFSIQHMGTVTVTFTVHCLALHRGCTLPHPIRKEIDASRR